MSFSFHLRGFLTCKQAPERQLSAWGYFRDRLPLPCSRLGKDVWPTALLVAQCASSVLRSAVVQACIAPHTTTRLGHVCSVEAGRLPGSHCRVLLATDATVETMPRRPRLSRSAVRCPAGHTSARATRRPSSASWASRAIARRSLHCSLSCWASADCLSRRVPPSLD